MTFEEIYHNTKDKVYNLALHYTQNSDDAQEIAQDVFLAVHNSLNSFRNESRISTWIFRITINKSLDHLKLKKRKKRFGLMVSLFYEGKSDLKHDVQDFNHPGVQLEEQESLKRLFGLINELPDNQKTALILSKIEQKTQAEIADIMEISAKAVESLVQRAKVNLQKKLDKTEG